MSIETMTKLATVTVGSGGASTIEFTSIPATYTDLCVKLSLRSDRSATYDNIVINPNSSTTNLSGIYLYGYGSGAGSATDTGGLGTFALDGGTATASTFSNAEIYFPNYAGSNYKSFAIDAVIENNATDARQGLTAQLWSSTSAITSIKITPATGPNFVQYSTATLYGIKNARQTAGNSIKATGGNISFDGTYVVHTFTSSGTFTPTKPLTVDYLVVAGGGGGYNATNGTQGGGGAGGYRTSIGGSSLSVTVQDYTVTVGAGGGAGTKGSDSAFSTITSTGGGSGDKYWGGNSDGGSGGGAGYAAAAGDVGLGNTPSTTPSQGNNGGQAYYAGGGSSNRGAGGGGGSSAVGGNAVNNGSSSTSGNGGAGTSNSISGSAVTYAAGGGGGMGGNGTAGSGGSSIGGNGGTTSANGTDGIIYTGSGGGGLGTNSYAAGKGSSGIVIVRYKA